MLHGRGFLPPVQHEGVCPMHTMRRFQPGDLRKADNTIKKNLYLVFGIFNIPMISRKCRIYTKLLFYRLTTNRKCRIFITRLF